MRVRGRTKTRQSHSKQHPAKMSARLLKQITCPAFVLILICLSGSAKAQNDLQPQWEYQQVRQPPWYLSQEMEQPVASQRRGGLQPSFALEQPEGGQRVGWFKPHPSLQAENSLPGMRFTDFLRESCVCQSELACECCGGFNNQLLHRSVCLNWEVDMRNSSVHTVVKRDAIPIFAGIFSVLPIPPFCVPLGPLPVNVCLKLHDISHHTQPNSSENTFHVCASVALNLIFFDLFSLPLGCMDISGNGIQPHQQQSGWFF